MTAPEQVGARLTEEERALGQQHSPWRWYREDAVERIVAERVRAAKAEALREAADDLVWKKPDTCPCDHPEDCCGSAKSCDAMQPIQRLAGVDWLRDRADRIEAER